tara:strand:+ start:2007 stop:2354 length:348 start_codon:yes stop_codon:yes gene_type:complete
MIKGLRQRLALETETDVEDGYGGFSKQWVDIATIRCAVHPVSGRESFSQMQQRDNVTHRVIIRYRAGVTRGMRFRYEDDSTRALNVQSVQNFHSIERKLDGKRWTVLQCEEGAVT